jgi:predicted regulator of amino acid metabolism with ACT domain
MDRQVRPTLRLRLTGPSERDGEMTLAELAKVAERTQRVVTRIAQAMIDDRTAQRLRHSIGSATTLSLVGLRAGSTVLDIALPEATDDQLIVDDMPQDLGEMALTAFVESLAVLHDDESQPVLPVGVDEKAANEVDGWLRALSSYSDVEINAQLGRDTVQHFAIAPREARDKLKRASSQPVLPYISADNQSLTGRLYALNLRTGTFRIEDDARHSIQLTVPEDLRLEAAQLVNTRVRAIGRAALDRQHRLAVFSVSALEQVPELPDQVEFFKRHELEQPPRVIEEQDLTGGVITDVTDDEIASFMAALGME